MNVILKVRAVGHALLGYRNNEKLYIIIKR